jgi:ubiquinone/menaquinone biosynthesis C-methylase UbiE
MNDNTTQREARVERNESIQRQFGAAAQKYVVSTYHTRAPDLENMLAAVELSGTERVLDVGTGTGHTALAFAPHVEFVVGLDITEAMLDQARKLAAQREVENVSFERGDAMAMDYATDSFDLVTCRVCAHHFARPQPAVSEMARVLRPGGVLLIVDSIASEDPGEDTWLNCIELLRDPSHARNYRVSEWLAMISEAGLSAECLDTWAVPLEFEEWVTRMGTPELERQQLRTLFSRAPDHVRDALRIRPGDDCGFDIPIGMFRGR